MKETESAFLSTCLVTGSRMDHDIEIDKDDLFFKQLLTMRIGRERHNFGFSFTSYRIG